MSESSESIQPRLRRRQWLAATGAIAATAATAAALPVTRDPVPMPSGPEASSGERSGYEVTQHVLRYYQTTRI